jgi:poly-gamma-glutamate system protein
MKRCDVGLALVCMLALGGFLYLQESAIRLEPIRDRHHMEQAVVLAERWVRIIAEHKRDLGLLSAGQFRGNGLLGVEYTPITTTLGSLDAKETAINPEFAALIVRILEEDGFDSSSVVGVACSGSFPGLSIACLAALHTIGAKVILASSLGASSFGANEPEATWIDMERWLIEAGELSVKSSLVSAGAENDAGEGLPEGGFELIRRACERCGVQLSVPGSLREAIDEKIRLFDGIDLLVNIGGNHAMLGGCVHASGIPPGFHRSLHSCMDENRGVILRLSSQGIPVLHLLNIREIAARYGLPIGYAPSTHSASLFARRTVDRTQVTMVILLLLASLLSLRWHCGPPSRRFR